MAGITEDGPHVVTDEWVLGQAGILDVMNDDQVPGQPMFSGPDFCRITLFQKQCLQEGPVLLALMTYRLMPQELVALRVMGLIVLAMMIPSQDVMMASPVLHLELNPHLSRS